MKPLQLILCVETDQKAQTDVMYVQTIIQKFYQLNPNIKIRYLYLKGKYRYNHQDVEREINYAQTTFAKFSGGHSQVVYILDKDQFDHEATDADFFLNVEAYCAKRQYDVVWFVRNVEEVMIGQSVNNKDKKAAALSFVRKQGINKVDMERLMYQQPTLPKTSNIITVFDRYLTVKDGGR